MWFIFVFLQPRHKDTQMPTGTQCSAVLEGHTDWVRAAVFLWDGKTDRGQVVTSGLYVVGCRLFPAGDGMGWTEKVVIGCGRRDS